MSDKLKNAIFAGVAVLAFGVIVIGLVRSDTSAPTEAERVDALASAIKCPFCNGESLKESQSTVATEYRVLIAQRVAEGATDDEVIAEFAANFGDSYILDTSTSSWSIVLWIVPVLAVTLGVSVVLWMYTSARRRRQKVAP
ncbi:MAG: cytochrome c-type biogenesis protein CcmH [Actinomycetia bacterium]|nr:cytochrome c-type biogenesis protein CcmH [Actinomycetes bacterium]